MPEGLVRSGDYRLGNPVPATNPEFDSNPVPSPDPNLVSNPIPQPDPTLDSNPVTWVPDPAHFGNAVTL